MAIDTRHLDVELLSLPAGERARLAQLLFESLENADDLVDDEEFDRHWTAEANRRYEEYRQGRMGARPAEEVLAEARAALKK